jgi:ABC-type uncharacterized transport system fused permease/ATPase subunit
MSLDDGMEEAQRNTILQSEWATMNQRIDNIDARIWQGAGILLVLSIGGFSFINWNLPLSLMGVLSVIIISIVSFGGFSFINWNLPLSLMGVLSVIIISIVSLVILYIWLHVFHRWIYIQAILTCPPKRSPVIMLVNWDKKGGINGKENLHSGTNHQQAEGS